MFTAMVLFSFVLVSFLIDFGLRRIETSSYGVFNRIVDGKINSTVLITGSSRAMNHYDPRVITKLTGASAWNIGINGSQTDMQLAVLQTYLRHNAAPALLIHNLDSFAFTSSKAGVTFPEQYVPYLNEPPIYGALHGLDTTWWRARYLPLYGHAVEDMRFSWLIGVEALFGRQPAEDRFSGFQPRSTSWNEDFDKFRRANPAGVSFPVEPDAVRDFEQLIVEETSRHGQVLLVNSPVYYEMQELDRGRAEFLATVREIAARHHALVWDYSDSPICHRRDFFYNSQHLNAEGAAAFSLDLSQRLAASGLLETVQGRVGLPAAPAIAQRHD